MSRSIVNLEGLATLTSILLRLSLLTLKPSKAVLIIFLILELKPGLSSSRGLTTFFNKTAELVS